jgi:hypothetical protein
MKLEEVHAKSAARVIASLGGKVTFAEYDAGMRAEFYGDMSGGVYRRAKNPRHPVPLHWTECAGHGAIADANKDKRAVFEACAMGLVEQTETGYRLVRERQVA